MFGSLKFLFPMFSMATLLPMFTNTKMTQTLALARAGHGPEVILTIRQKAPPPKPPKAIMELVTYPSPAGKIVGYLTNPPTDGKRHPAIIWISGGDTAIGDFWTPQPRANDQTASVFRERGIVVFYPSLRGLNGNPGQIEGFYGELDDIVAATAWLKSQPFVDADRVYLGGHSTGGTMALLAAEYADHWKAVFAFGPVSDPRNYGAKMVPIDADNESTARLRAPVYWLNSITVPTYVIEGDQMSNIGELYTLKLASENAKVHFSVGVGCTHFSVLRPTSETIAELILNDKIDLADGTGGLAASC